MIADVTRGLSEWWAPVLAFVAGLVSFASPCVLPLVPGYLAFVSGTNAIESEPAPASAGSAGSSAVNGGSTVRPDSGTVAAGAGAVAAARRAPQRSRADVLPMLMFVAGFSIVFVAFGVLAGQAPTGWLNHALHSTTLLRIAGVFVLLFGVAMVLYALRLGNVALYADRRPLLSKVRPGPAGALPLGMAFALGWSACIGPVLGAILAIASTQGGAVRGGFLLLMYSLGLGVPFVLIGFGLQRLVRVLDVIKRNYHWVAGVSGVIMIAIGLLLITGLWQEWVTPWLNRLTRITPPI